MSMIMTGAVHARRHASVFPTAMVAICQEINFAMKSTDECTQLELYVPA